jgi:hypothetical protein
MNDRPEQPTIFEINLYESGVCVSGIKLWQVQTMTDSAETRCLITMGNKEEIKGNWSTYERLIDVYPYWNGIGKVNKRVMSKCKEWFAWSKQNDKQYQLYLELKEKFENKEEIHK